MSANEPIIRTYGNWRVPARAGFGNLSFGTSMGLIAGLVCSVLVNALFGLAWAFAFVVVVAMVVLAASSRDKHGVSLIDKLGEKMRFFKSRRKRANIYRAGVTGVDATEGKCRLPGILAHTTLSTHMDGYERDFTIIHHADGTMAVTMAVAPPGSDLVDQDRIDVSVARWGMWLAELGSESGIVGASVTVESVPDLGEGLRREVDRHMVDDAPPFARQVLTDIVDSYRVGAAQVRSWVTLTFDPAKMGAKRRSKAQAAREIATRLPGLTQTLQSTGAGAVHLLSPTELCRMVRVAYDPASEVIFEEAATNNMEVDVTWGDCGPVGAYADWDSYRHDSGLSRTWVVSRPPRGTIQSGVLASVMGTNRDIERKRVTVLYRPIDASKAPDIVERDRNQADAKVQSANKPTARARKEARAAERTAEEEASGAGLVDFGIIITATTTHDDLDDTAAALTSAAGSSRLQIRPAYAAQDSAFALALPVGLRPASQMIGGGW